MDQGSSVHILC